MVIEEDETEQIQIITNNNKRNMQQKYSLALHKTPKNGNNREHLNKSSEFQRGINNKSIDMSKTSRNFNQSNNISM